MSREKTTDEVMKEFLTCVAGYIHYWSTVPLDKESDTVEWRLSGLAHSLLVVIDGCNMSMPQFILAPNPHPDDKPYAIDNGEDWFPENDENKINGNISGGLHEVIFRVLEDFKKKVAERAEGVTK